MEKERFKLVELALIYVGITVSMVILSLELGIIGGLITMVHSLILSLS